MAGLNRMPRLNPNDFELFLLGMDHRAESRNAKPTGPVGLVR